MSDCIGIRMVLPSKIKVHIGDKRFFTLVVGSEEIVFECIFHEYESYNLLYLKSQPLESGKEIDLISVENAIHYLKAFKNLGIQTNDKLASAFVTEAGKKYFSAGLQSDFVGVKKIDCKHRFLSMDAQLDGGIDIKHIIKDLNFGLSQQIQLDDKVKRAVELFNSSEYLTRFSKPAEFLLLMSSLECLIEQNERASTVTGLIEKFKEDAQRTIMDEEERNRLKTQISFLKVESIGQSGKLLANQLLGSNTYKSMSPGKFFKAAYDLRSKLTHDGITGTNKMSVDEDLTILKSFVADLIRAYIVSKHP